MISAQWFQGFKGTSEERVHLEQTIRSSTITLDILTKVVEQELKKVQSSKQTDYDKASWAYYQADQNGAARAYSQILQMTKMDRNKE